MWQVHVWELRSSGPPGCADPWRECVGGLPPPADTLAACMCACPSLTLSWVPTGAMRLPCTHELWHTAHVSLFPYIPALGLRVLAPACVLPMGTHVCVYPV